MTTLHRLEVLPRSPRRLWVLVGLIGYPAAYGLLAVLKAASLPPALVLTVFGITIALTIAGLTVGYVYARGRTEGRRGHLDERDRHLILRAYAVSHRVLAAVLLVAVAAVELYLTLGNTVTIDAPEFLPVMLWAIIYVPALPTLMLAWIEPELPDDA